MSSTQGQPEQVVFLNEPRYTEHEADKKFNDSRRELAGELKEFLAIHSLFRGKKTEVTFSHNGISSLVCMLNAEGQTLVLKIPLNPSYSRSEAAFLRAWERVGVNVPHVVETGEIRGHVYLLMTYIDAATLKNAYTVEELIAKEVYVKMGAALRKMHVAIASGYGDLINGRAEYPDIRTWLASPFFQDKVAYIKANNILSDARSGSLEDALEILFRKIGSNPDTVYGHSDFSVGNVFATEPLTIFDPIPFLNHPYMDLARSILLAIRPGSFEASQHLMRGYFGAEEYDMQLLQASLLINAYQKAGYWYQTARHEAIENMQTYLVKAASGRF